MTFGDGNANMYPLVSLGVGSHEISHGFTEQHSNLAYFGQSGGINEAFSDMAAQAAEYYSKQQCSWSIGEEIFKGKHEALRYMERPSKDGKSIDKASQYRPQMDVHHASGVYNRLFYVLAHQPGWDVRQAFQVMIKANMDYWTPFTNFKEGACGILSATEDLKYPLESVKKSLDDVSISYEYC